ncbi:MAG: oligosaccharide flippase family protein [Clostridia bacterium]|nr:oligosaccharide flippase family protein [Clostridia bacterium]
MPPQSMKRQAAVLTGANIVVRFAGFVMRIIFSRIMGAEAVGLMELAGSAHMLAITPVTAGLPLGVSRLTAKADATCKAQPLQAGRWLVNRLSAFLIPLFLILSPWIAKALGDVRTWPSLLFTAPCIWILGHSAVLNGYCYGINQALPPALSEICEQAIRFVLSLGILLSFPHLATHWLAAAPAFATMAAEAVGLMLVLCLLKLPKAGPADNALIQKTARLSAPPTFSRFCSTGLRSLNAIIIPLRLQASGLAANEAMARLGMLTGMALPLVMLPGVFTSALSILSAPALAAREENPRLLRQMSLRLMAYALGISLISAIGLYGLSPFIANRLYRQAELANLLRLLCPSVVMTGLTQVLSGMIAGVGRQKHAFYGTVAGALTTLAISWILTAHPLMQHLGAAIGMMAGQAVTMVWNLELIRRVLRKGHA